MQSLVGVGVLSWIVASVNAAIKQYVAMRSIKDSRDSYVTEGTFESMFVPEN